MMLNIHMGSRKKDVMPLDLNENVQFDLGEN